MNTYPTLSQSVNSNQVVLYGRQVDRATNGEARSRTFFTSPKKTFKVYHNFVSPENKLILETFIQDNSNIPFYFFWKLDGQTYTCMFGEDNPGFEITSGLYWNITVFLVEV